MKIKVSPSGKNYGVITPDETLAANAPGQFFKKNDRFLKPRSGRFQLPGIAGGCDQEIIREATVFDFRQMFHERSRITAPKNKGIDVLFFQADRLCLGRAERIPDRDLAVAQMLHEPGAVKSRDIAAPGSTDDHLFLHETARGRESSKAAAFKLQQFGALGEFLQGQVQCFSEIYFIFPSLINFDFEQKIIQVLF
jgi:hypothetical protein